MVSLRLKSGTAIEVAKGCVEITANCVALYKFSTNRSAKELILAYCLAAGEIVRQEKEGEYVVEF